MAGQDSKIAWIGLTIAAGALALSGAGLFQQPRYGYTNVEQLIAGYGPAADVERQIEEELAPMRQKLDEQRKATGAVESKALEQQDALSAADLAVLQLQLVTARQRQDELDRQLTALETRLRAERMKPVYVSLNRQMRRFGEENGYAMIWTATTAGNLAYASDAANVTDDLLSWISTHPE